MVKNHDYAAYLACFFGGFQRPLETVWTALATFLLNPARSAELFPHETGVRPPEVCHFSGQAAPFRARSREAARMRSSGAPLAPPH